ncbi:integral membrane channel protein [Rutstroemia sp. NJR-2017a BBW]|nr:integral membrane channel protein [Rutstroemia sp. NJR-2017a BBW]
MLSSLLRPKKSRRPAQEMHSPFSSLLLDPSSPTAARRERALPRHASADFTETEIEDDTEDEREDQQDLGEGDDAEIDEVDEDGLEEEDGDEDPPLLPIFSAAHLDSLPVYNLTHAIRLIILPRTETTLTWDQLRSPQVSQFLVKPMQQQIRTSHFSRATLYALMANCLQFRKESQANPGNAGNSLTRALVCELLAIKLLKEYNTRELIDALSYDFFPLQGVAPPETPTNLNPGSSYSSIREKIFGTSTRRTAVGSDMGRDDCISFCRRQFTSWGCRANPRVPEATPEQRKCSATIISRPRSVSEQVTRNTPPATANPDKKNCDPLRSSRCVPVQAFTIEGTALPAVLLYMLPCHQRSTDITGLEVIFWFWSAGFMLDEVVGFNEQGFSLYIMSFWNAFDLGILLLLTVYYCMRLYGIFLVDYGRDEWNSMAYDVLATNAILLFPRLFSVLDHYRYFSQLLIAFRLMAIDLVAVFVLILIACSGFFVAFTLSFGKAEYDAAGVAYKIFQILMGFTPAAWEAWETYNFLGKAILVLFLFICHFLVVTILITVLTNSFMAIVSNANEEHQFVFAVNTISMVKNDALFSYVAPTNIIAWILTPLRFFFPFRTFIKMNRNVIKLTHFPLLFSICAYEKIFLARSVFEPTDLVEKVGRSSRRGITFHEPRPGLFSPNLRRHESSIAGFQKDRALDEVFRLAPRETFGRNRPSFERRQTHKVINNWMDRQGVASPPQEQDRSILERLETRKNARKATFMRQRGISREISATKSVASDPIEFMSTGFHDIHRTSDDELHPNSFGGGHTDADGDDELLSNDEDEAPTADKEPTSTNFSGSGSESEDYFQTPTATRFVSPDGPPTIPLNQSPPKQKASPKKKSHDRNLSTNTILFNPVIDNSSSFSPPRSRPLTAKLQSVTNTGSNTPIAASGSRTPRTANFPPIPSSTRPRPIFPNRTNFQSVPNLHNKAEAAPRTRLVRHKDSSLDISMSEMGLGDHTQLGLGAVPSSFATQMALATNMANLKRVKGEESADGMMGRLMLARMKTLEEGFAEVVREFRGIGMRTAGNSSVENEPSGGRRKVVGEKRKGGEKEKGKRPGTAGNVSVGRSEGDGLGRGPLGAKGKERERERGYFDGMHSSLHEHVDGGGDLNVMQTATGTSHSTSEFQTPFETPFEEMAEEDEGLDRYIAKGNSF